MHIPKILLVWLEHVPVSLAGKGNHSAGGRPRIRPAVVRWLTEAGHRFAAAADTGSIVVQVTPADERVPT